MAYNTLMRNKHIYLATPNLILTVIEIYVYLYDDFFLHLEQTR